MRRTLLIAALVAIVCPAEPADAAVPGTMSISGALFAQGGGPAVDGDHILTFRLYGVEKGGKAVWSEGPAVVTAKQGRFVRVLGTPKPIDAALLGGLAQTWLGVQVGNEPELPRVRLHSVAFAARASSSAGLDCSGCVTGKQLASGTVAAAHIGFPYAGAKTKGGPALQAADLNCTACVSVSELKFDGDVDLGGNALKVSKMSATSVVAGTVAANSFVGDGSKLSGLKVPSGTCPKGQLMRGIDGDGKPQCAVALSADNVPGDLLDEVSNNLLTNQFIDAVASKNTPVAIQDNNPTGVGDEVTVPDLGVAQKLAVSVHIKNSNLATVELQLFDPNNAKYVLFAKGAAKGNELKTTWPAPSKPTSGDLGAWSGKNPKGKWRLRVIDTAFFNNGSDGAVVAWSIDIHTLSSKKVAANGLLQANGGLRLPIADKPPLACNEAAFGHVWASRKEQIVYFCNGEDWFPMSIGSLGTASHPAASCLAIKQKWGAAKSGLYWIDSDGKGGLGAWQAWCDMDTAGGGWTLVNTKVSTAFIAWSDKTNTSCGKSTTANCASRVPTGMKWTYAMWRFSTTDKYWVQFDRSAHAGFTAFLEGAKVTNNPTVGGFTRNVAGKLTGPTSVSSMHYYYTNGISENHGGGDQWLDMWNGADGSNKYKDIEGNSALAGTKCVAAYCKSAPIWMLVR